MLSLADLEFPAADLRPLFTNAPSREAGGAINPGFPSPITSMFNPSTPVLPALPINTPGFNPATPVLPALPIGPAMLRMNAPSIPLGSGGGFGFAGGFPGYGGGGQAASFAGPGFAAGTGISGMGGFGTSFGSLGFGAFGGGGDAGGWKPKLY